MRARRFASGFSLLEMLLVMALIAAASLLAVAAFGGGMQGIKLRAGARDLAAQMRFARAVAISSGQAQDVVVDPQARRWQGAKGRSGDLPDGGDKRLLRRTVETVGEIAQPRGEAALGSDHYASATSGMRRTWPG